MLKKAFYIFGSVISSLFFLIALFIIIMGIIAQKNNSMVRIFGYSYSVVATDSMEPTIMIGEIVIAESKAYDDVIEGDIIVFFSDEYQEFFVHRVHDISENGDLITKGDNPLAPIDDVPVTTENYFGTVVRHGNFLNIGDLVLKYRSLVFILIILIFAFIIIRETISIVKNLNKKNQEETQKDFDQEKQKKLLEEKERIKQEILDEIRNSNKN
jgi:signal peptidase I